MRHRLDHRDLPRGRQHAGRSGRPATRPSADADDVAGPTTGGDSVAITTHADLEVTKSDGQSSVVAGAATVHTYTITVTNHGPSDALLVSLSDTWPTGFTQGTITGTGCGAGPNFTCALGTIAAGGSKVVTVTYTVPSSTTANQTNTATATSATTDPGVFPNTASDTNTVTTIADLSISKTDGVATATPGASTTYTIVVGNAGPSNVVGASVTDTFPAAITGTSWTAVQAGGATGFTASGSGNIADTVNLPSGSSITYTVVASISAAATGSLVNTASVASAADTTSGNNSASDTDTLTVGQPVDQQDRRRHHRGARQLHDLHDHRGQRRSVQRGRRQRHRHLPRGHHQHQLDGGR